MEWIPFERGRSLREMGFPEIPDKNRPPMPPCKPARKPYALYACFIPYETSSLDDLAGTYDSIEDARKAFTDLLLKKLDLDDGDQITDSYDAYIINDRFELIADYHGGRDEWRLK